MKMQGYGDETFDLPDAVLARGYLWVAMIKQHIEQVFRSFPKDKRRPHVGYDHDGVTMEWWGFVVDDEGTCFTRKLTVHVGAEETTWIKIWGPVGEGIGSCTDEVGAVDSPFQLDRLLAWVLTKEVK